MNTKNFKKVPVLVGEIWSGYLKETDIKSPQTIKTKLLYPFRKELEDFVFYPERSQWKFNKVPMKKWLQENFKRVWGSQ